jgi:hypothetical protein
MRGGRRIARHVKHGSATYGHYKRMAANSVSVHCASNKIDVFAAVLYGLSAGYDNGGRNISNDIGMGMTVTL